MNPDTFTTLLEYCRAELAQYWDDAFRAMEEAAKFFAVPQGEHAAEIIFGGRTGLSDRDSVVLRQRIMFCHEKAYQLQGLAMWAIGLRGKFTLTPVEGAAVRLLECAAVHYEAVWRHENNEYFAEQQSLTEAESDEHWCYTIKALRLFGRAKSWTDSHIQELVEMCEGKPAVNDSQPASRANLKGLRRENVLSPIIDEAITECGNSKTAAVWNKLRDYAVAQKTPFYGITEEGLQYMNQEDIPKHLSKRALGDRLKRLSKSR